MKEEQVTKVILKWLIANRWTIVCYDFPQSGTGKSLHPNSRNEGKNKDAIIPDVVAVRDGICVFLENKDRFYYPDYEKQHALMTSNDYSNDISALLEPFSVHTIYYGIGLPTAKHKQGSKEAAHLVDFILCVNDDFSVETVYNPKCILFSAV